MSRKNLTKLELQVMRALWAVEPEPATVREVAERVNAGRRTPLAYTTVQTMLRILRDKGALRVRPGDGRAHTYVAALSRDEVTTSMIGDLVDRLYDGSAQPLLTRLIEHESLTRDELEDLRKLIDRHLDGEGGVVSSWAAHVALYAAGLTMAAAALAILTAFARRYAAACHRMLVAALLAAFVLPFTQIAVEGRAAGLAPPAVRALWPSPESPEPAIAGESTSDASPVLIFDSLESALAGPADNAGPAKAGTVEPGWPSLPSLLAGLWIAGIVILGRRLAARIAATTRAVQDAMPVVDPEVLAAWERIAGHVRVEGIRLLASPTLEMPACCGLFRRLLLVPADPESRPRATALECALLHEAIHLERRDPLVAFLQSLFTLALWWHPAAWWLARELDFWRELSCDEEVVRRTGRRRGYAGALLEHAARISGVRGGPDPCPSLIAWTRTGTQIRRRIEMLVRNRKPMKPLRRAAAVTAALVAGFGIWSSQIALAATLFPPQTPDEVVEVTEQEAPPPAEGRLGLSLDEVGEALAAQIGRPAGEMMLVTGVEEGSVAEKAGVQKWDVITAVEGRAPATMERIQEARKQVNEGGSARLTVSRKGRRLVLNLGTRGARRNVTPRTVPAPPPEPPPHDPPVGRETETEAAPLDRTHHKEHLEALHEAMEKLGRGEVKEALKDAHRALEEAAPHLRHGVEEAHRAVEESMAVARRAIDEAAPHAREGAEEARRAVQEAMKHAERAMAEGKQAWKRSLEDSHRQVERATEESRTQVERAMQEAQRQVERATAASRAQVERALQQAQREVERATAAKRADVERAAQEARRAHEEAGREHRESAEKHADELRRHAQEAENRTREARNRKEVEERDRAAEREARTRRPGAGKSDPREAGEAAEEERLRAELDATRKALEDARRRLEELRKKERDQRRERDDDPEDDDVFDRTKAAPAAPRPGRAPRSASGDAPAARTPRNVPPPHGTPRNAPPHGDPFGPRTGSGAWVPAPPDGACAPFPVPAPPPAAVGPFPAPARLPPATGDAPLAPVTPPPPAVGPTPAWPLNIPDLPPVLEGAPATTAPPMRASPPPIAPTSPVRTPAPAPAPTPIPRLPDPDLTPAAK